MTLAVTTPAIDGGRGDREGEAQPSVVGVVGSVAAVDEPVPHSSKLSMNACMASSPWLSSVIGSSWFACADLLELVVAHAVDDVDHAVLLGLREARSAGP